MGNAFSIIDMKIETYSKKKEPIYNIINDIQKHQKVIELCPKISEKNS